LAQGLETHWKMGLIRKYESCVGLLLFKFGQRTVELWYCPAWYEIKEHSHPQEDIELMYLFGKTIFYRRKAAARSEEQFNPRWYHVFRRFTVAAGWSHRFDVGDRPLVFINFARWKVGVKPTSASVDFQLTHL